MYENATGALLLCRAAPSAVRPAARLLRERLLLAPAGEGWSVLVPEDKPWLHGDEPVDQVAAGWATALAVASSWSAVALWWDGERAGFVLGTGLRRPVGYLWLADGTPAGEYEVMRCVGVRLELDPVLDVQTLTELTLRDPAADAAARLLGLTAVLSRIGLTLPTGLAPGEPADRLREVVRVQPAAEQLDPSALRNPVQAERDVFEEGPLGQWSRGRRARLLGGAELMAGIPLAAWGLRRRSGGWTAAAALLMAHGALGLGYDRMWVRS
ncbi:hypothetical protein [Streptomyces sp. NBC_00344]|uniref:hypothetical protein n=1 Tax=Streptomyces sp. NBC_00344 TaxID=2975720 RepID=UPI002E1E0C50